MLPRVILDLPQLKVCRSILRPLTFHFGVFCEPPGPGGERPFGAPGAANMFPLGELGLAHQKNIEGADMNLESPRPTTIATGPAQDFAGSPGERKSHGR